MRIERSMVKRDANRPELAQGDRTVIELDPEQLRRMFTAGEQFLGELNRLLKKPRARRRRRSTGTRSS
jgi:hypothetical protein